MRYKQKNGCAMHRPERHRFEKGQRGGTAAASIPTAKAPQSSNSGGPSPPVPMGISSAPPPPRWLPAGSYCAAAGTTSTLQFLISQSITLLACGGGQAGRQAGGQAHTAAESWVSRQLDIQAVLRVGT